MQTFTASPKIFLLIATIILVIFLPPLINGYLSTSWPSVQGKVIKSDIKSHSSGGSTSYEVMMSYLYEVNGQEFTGKKFSYNRQIREGSWKKMRGYQENYKAGSIVTIYYSPSKPKKSTLVPGFSILDLIISSIGAVMLISGITVYLKTGSLNKGINSMDERSQKKLRSILK